MDIIIILAGALAIDLLFGEPPLALHPVVWMGKVTNAWEKFVNNRRPVIQFILGTVFTVVTIALFALPSYFLMAYLKGWNFLVYLAAGMVLFKITFSLKELRQAARQIKLLLLDQNLPGARFGLRSLVKRDAHDLTEPLIVSATVESVTENTCDSFVAPLLYFLILGVPGAMAYRVINTLDAMIGLHGKYEYLGKFAARLDDVVNIIPARLTGLLIVVAAFLLRKNPRAAWRVMVRDHSRTASPNAGWPMSAAAGALDVRLIKTGYYQLGDEANPLVPKTIDYAVQLMFCSAISWTILCFGVEVTRIAIAAKA
jgi:adenosylcobinamide-phosphate synthase